MERIQVSASPASLGLVIPPPQGSFWSLPHAVESIFSWNSLLSTTEIRVFIRSVVCIFWISSVLGREKYILYFFMSKDGVGVDPRSPSECAAHTAAGTRGAILIRLVDPGEGLPDRFLVTFGVFFRYSE